MDFMWTDWAAFHACFPESQESRFLPQMMDEADSETDWYNTASRMALRFEVRIESKLRKLAEAKPAATKKITLMTLPPEIRLKIYDYLKHTVSATSNLDIKDTDIGCITLNKSDNKQATVFFFDTFMPQLTVLCKKFSTEYQYHVLSGSIMSFTAVHQIPIGLKDIPWHGIIPRRDALQAIRKCIVTIAWTLALGAGKRWEQSSRSWSVRSPEQRKTDYGEWTPTTQVFKELRDFIVLLRETMAPGVEFYFTIAVPSEYAILETRLAGRFDVEAFADLLADTAGAHAFGIRLTYTCQSYIQLDSPTKYFERRRHINAPTPSPIPPSASKITWSTETCFWTATMIRSRDKVWTKSPWSFFGVDGEE